jgi:hypothetical protein
VTITSDAATNSLVGLGCWTILDEASDEVRAIVTHEPDGYTVRDCRGVELGNYPTARLALSSVAA